MYAGRRAGGAPHRGHGRSRGHAQHDRVDIPTLDQLADALTARRRAGDTQLSIISFLHAAVGPQLKVVTENVGLGGLSAGQQARLVARVVASGPQEPEQPAEQPAEQPPEAPEAAEGPTPHEAAASAPQTSKKKRRGRGVPVPLHARPADGGADPLHLYCGGRTSVALRVMVCRHGTRVATHVPRTELVHHSCVVFDALSWEVLSVAPRTFSDHSPRDLTVSDDYVIARAEDGTLCTLYRWDNPLEEPEFGSTLCISTGRGYDVSGIQCLFSDKSWSAVLLETMQRVNDPAPSFLAQEDRASLADVFRARLVRDFRGVERLALGDGRVSGPRFCHTVSFRNHDLHPLLHDPEDVWSVQSVPLTAEAAEYRSQLPGWEPGSGRLQPCGGIMGFRPQTTYTLDELETVVRSRGVANPTGDRPLRISDLRMMLETAKEEAELVIKVADSMSEEYGEELKTMRKPFEYGYVLRSRDVTLTRENSDVIIESPLLAAVRAFMYQKPRIEDYEESCTSFGSRHTYNAVRAILMPPEKRDSFLALFPQYRATAERCDEFLRNVSHYVLTRARKDSAAGPAPTGDPSSVHVVGDAVLSAVRRETGGRFDPQAEGADAMVRGFLYTTSNAAVTMQALRL